MELTLLGTGAADGWPSPFCTCASCQGMRARGEIRGQTSALIDGVLLLDCGPETPRAAERAGHHLAGVHTILLTHAHPDHVGPAALLWRSWARRPEPLEVVGPSSAIEACRHWVSPTDPVTFTVVDADETLHRHGYVVVTLAAHHSVSSHGTDDATVGAVLYDVTAPDGARILYATDTGPLPRSTVAAIASTSPARPYDAVLLEETYGDGLVGVDLGDNHHDLETFGLTIAALRTVGAVADRTDVIAIHLGHHNPPTAELDERLSPWGARTVPDGTRLTIPAKGRTDPGQRSGPHRTFVLGGARSGKSRYAETLLGAHPDVTYLATARPDESDDEWTLRIAAHRTRRRSQWRTVETTDLDRVLDDAVEGQAVLIDCLTLWLTSVCDDAGLWNHDDGDRSSDQASLSVVQDRVGSLVAALRRTRARVVLVSNEVGGGVVPATRSGREFRDLLGYLNATVSAECETTILVVAGHPLTVSSHGQESSR